MQIACINSKTPQLLQPMNPVALGMGHYQQGSFVPATVPVVTGGSGDSSVISQMVMLPGTNIGMVGSTNTTNSVTVTEQFTPQMQQSKDQGEESIQRQNMAKQLQQQQLQQKQQLQQQQQQAQQQQQLQHLEQQQALVAFQQMQSFSQQQQLQQQILQMQAGQNLSMNAPSNMGNQFQNFMFQTPQPSQQQQQQQQQTQHNQQAMQQFSQQLMAQQNQSNDMGNAMLNAITQQQQQYHAMFLNQQQQMGMMSNAMDVQLHNQQQQLQFLQSQNNQPSTTESQVKQANGVTLQHQQHPIMCQTQQQQHPPPSNQ
jgi:hypothetical protein